MRGTAGKAGLGPDGEGQVTGRAARLTKRQIERLDYAGDRERNERCVIWDTDPRGFGVRVFPSGRKAFVLSYRNAAGRKRLMSLGDVAVIKLDAARSRAKAELVAIESRQADPVAEKKQRALEAQTGSVETMFRAYVAAIDAKRPDAVRWYAERFIFPRFGAQPWRDVRRSDVREWHARIESAYNANRSLQALRAAFYWRLWSEDDAAGNQSKRDTRNPCAGIAIRPERKRTVRLELGELPKLEQAIDAETNDPYLRAYFRFVLAVGSRKTEALSLRWDDVTLKGETPGVVFRDTKGGGDRTVPLSRYTVALLRELPKVAGNPYVFVGRREREHLKSPNKAWLRIRARAGLGRVRIHDLRRTFGSWLGDAGFTSKQIGTVLGHKTDITSRVYMQLGSAVQREAVTAVDKLMTSARKPRRRGKVVRLRGQRP